jgi:hypothetical protein
MFEQTKFKLEKKKWDLKTYRKNEKKIIFDALKWLFFQMRSFDFGSLYPFGSHTNFFITKFA